MLELRPSCEHCNTALGPDSDQARICTFECTFCADCATWLLLGICPNCGGEFVVRPRRPEALWGKAPASTEVKHRPVDIEAHQTAVLARLQTGDLPEQVYAVAFCNGRTAVDDDGYYATAAEMARLAAEQPGYLRTDSVRTPDGTGITVSRWASAAAMINWRRVASHVDAQDTGRERWYDWYRSDVGRIERTSEFQRPAD